jgi:hypothetical protein
MSEAIFSGRCVPIRCETSCCLGAAGNTVDQYRLNLLQRGSEWDALIWFSDQAQCEQNRDDRTQVFTRISPTGLIAKLESRPWATNHSS